MTADESARADALRQRIAALRAGTQRCEDHIAIERLQRAYGFYIDKGYWREASNLFAEDATFEHGKDGVYRGRARIHELIVRLGGGNPGPGLPYGQLNQRLQLQGVVTLSDDGATARGRWRELAMLGQYGEWAAWGDGIHENDYVREDGVWKIAALRFYPNFVAPYEGGWAALEPATGDLRSEAARAFPPDGPATIDYRPFPEISVPPFHYPNPVTGKEAAR
ncbi:MAG: nuclear transport factor 2 family protein [Sphingomonas sp.]